MNRERAGYQSLMMTLRAPRAAIVFRSDENWQTWASQALFCACKTWGGLGLAMIPAADGAIHPALRRLVQAYDPDYVVGIHPTTGQMEVVQPGAISITSEDGTDLPAARRTALIKQSQDQILYDQMVARVRGLIVEDVSSFRQAYEGDVDGYFEQTESIQLKHIAQPFTSVDDLRHLTSGVGQVADGLGGVWGLAAAMHLGFQSSPGVPFESGNVPEARKEFLAISSARLNGLEWGSFTTTGWGAASQGLTRIGPVSSHRTPILVVLGSQSTDFSLAQGWDVTLAGAIWLPVDELEKGDAAGEDLAWLGQYLRSAGDYQRRRVIFTSTSLGFEVVEHIQRVLMSDAPIVRVNGEQEDSILCVASDELPWTGGGFWALNDQYQLPMALPASFDEHGSVTLQVDLPPIVPSDPSLSELRHWVIDVNFVDRVMARGRGLVDSALLASGSTPYESWVRSGRDGISCASGSWGLVMGGATRVQSMARPRLSHPGLMSWVSAMGKPTGVEADFSQAGARVEVLRRLWGSRAELTEAWSKDPRVLLSTFVAKAKTTKDSFPEGHGTVVRGEPFVTFEGMADALGGASSADSAHRVRLAIDDLIDRRILRRGLIIDCPECGFLRFVPIDDLNERNRCPRCSTLSVLVLERWRKPVAEPTWHYDLHLAARELLSDDGGIALLASAYLRRNSRTYEDISEVEFRKRAQEGPFAEVDLIAVRDNHVIVAEAKSVLKLSNTAQGRNRKCQKLVQIAALLRADELLLCSSAEGEWNQTDIHSLSAALRVALEGAVRVPRISTLTALNTAQPWYKSHTSAAGS